MTAQIYKLKKLPSTLRIFQSSDDGEIQQSRSKVIFSLSPTLSPGRNSMRKGCKNKKQFFFAVLQLCDPVFQRCAIKFRRRKCMQQYSPLRICIEAFCASFFDALELLLQVCCKHSTLYLSARSIDIQSQLLNVMLSNLIVVIELTMKAATRRQLSINSEKFNFRGNFSCDSNYVELVVKTTSSSVCNYQAAIFFFPVLSKNNG